MSTVSPSQWQQFISQHPQAHLLQTEEWGRFKAGFGWAPLYVINGDSGAEILFKRLPLGLSIAYIPKGPVGDDWSDLWKEVDGICRQQHAVFLKVEPDVWEPATDEFLRKMTGFTAESRTVQPRRSILIDLDGSEEDWLARMKQKTRYNVRLAEKKEVVVDLSADINEFYALMQVTGGRDGFGVHAQAYYQRAYELFHPLGQCDLLVARYNGKPLAALMVFASGSTAWYFYGASSDEERNRMPTYLLQWEAMRWAKKHGCRFYDLWGIPDEDEDVLEAQFTNRSDGLWGVYRFKRGYGGSMLRSVGAWDRIYQPLLYRCYQYVMRRREL
jgi:peptidoglycan pentaglycine glycine transferase (the first glycine)